MGTTAEKLTYLNETKTQLKDMLNLGGASLTTEPFRQYVDTLKNRYLYFMNNGTQEVWDNWEKVVGEGTTITLNNTEEAPMTIDLKGNTSQETTTGKNLFAGGDTTTTNGITFTKHSDGSYDIVGTATSPAYILNYVPLAESGIVNGETYTISTNQNITGLEIRIESYNGNTWLRATLGGLITFPKTHSADVTDATHVRFGLFVSSGTTINLKNLKIQLEKGSSVTSFEPYTGGQASPNPDYPQDIHVVSGDNSIVVGNGKNIFNMKEYASANSSYFTYSSSTGLTAIAKDNRATANVNYPIEVDTNTTYYIKTDTDKRLLIAQYNSNNVWITNNEVFNGGSFKPNANASYIRVKVADTLTSFPTVVGNVYISTSSDYTGESYPISLSSKNLIPNEVVLPLGTYGGATVVTLLDFGEDKTFSNLTLSFNFKDAIYTNSSGAFIDFVKNDGTHQYNLAGSFGISPNVNINGTKYLKRTSETTFRKLNVYVSGYANFTQGFISEAMLVEGTQELPYEAHFNPIELCKIGDYQDTIVKDNGKWYLNKQIGKVVLDGGEGWNKHGSIASWFYYDGIIDGYVLDNTQILIKTNYYTPKAYQGVPNLVNGECAYGSSDGGITHRFVIKNTDYTQVQDFKNWLSTHNTIVYYVLATPTYTEITDSTLLSQLNALAKSYNSQTNISQESNDLASLLNATALREMS